MSEKNEKETIEELLEDLKKETEEFEEKVHNVCNYSKVDDKSNKVIVAIITDGKENASREYNKATIKDLIDKKQKEGWEFIFLGANIDAVSEADSIGIKRDHALKYRNSAQGVRANYNAVSEFVAEAASEAETGNWKKEAVEDKN